MAILTLGSFFVAYNFPLEAVECRRCQLRGSTQLFKLRSEAIKHLKDHQKAGHYVPEYAFSQLERDMRHKDEVICHEKGVTAAFEEAATAGRRGEYFDSKGQYHLVGRRR